MTKFLPLFFVAIGFQVAAFAQENSPYSRYGLGDIAPNHNIYSRAMGGISAATGESSDLNYINPATLGRIYSTVFDIGTEADFRTLKSQNPVKKFTSANALFSYLQLAFPLTPTKMRKKGNAWGMNFGLRPLTKINYKIEKGSRILSNDSLYTLYEGSGGANEAFIGTGIRIKKFSIGVTGGYVFGNKNYSTRLDFINDTVTYYKSNSANQTTFGGLFVHAGMQYDFILDTSNKENPKFLRLGVYGNLQQKLRAKRDDIRETFDYDANTAAYRIDSVFESKDLKGTIDYPMTYGGGFSYHDAHWLFGADFEMTQWSKYRYYGQADQVQNSWVVRAGGEYYPAKVGTPFRKYFNFVKYRAGFYYGPDYIKTNNSRPNYAFTVGTGMPLSSLQRLGYYAESGLVMLNTALEIGGRGDKNTNIKETVVRFSVGISMNASWFIKRKYN